MTEEDVFLQEAVRRAVQTFQAVAAQPEPIASAAFGIACGELMEAANINLTAAAALLKVELDRRNLALCPPDPTKP